MPKKPAPDKASPTKTPSAAKRGLGADPPAADPTSAAALIALPASYADPPDLPVDVAIAELGSLARLAKTSATALAAVGLGADHTERLARFGRKLAAYEDAWQAARGGVKLTAKERALLAEAEALDDKLVAGGRWACRGDADAQAELTDIAEDSGLADTVSDLRRGVDFWGRHATARKDTDVTDGDLKRAIALADALDAAAQKEAADLGAAHALELRNRCFWAADELAKELREGGRYAFRGQPKVATRFTSRYRADANRRSRKKAKAKAAQPEAKPNGASPS